VARRAFLLGGSGQSGRALIPRLQERGWEVSIGSRGERDLPQGLEHLQVDRADTAALKRALGDGVDVLVDFVAFEREHAEQLLSLRDHIGSLVVLSSAAVYFEAEGPPKDDAAFPRLPVPLSERSPTAPPGPETYATKKAAIEQLLLGQDEVPATRLGAAAIHGPWCSWPREWHFVKRVLDDRRAIVLAYRGESRFHPISVYNLAELIWLASERPGRRVLNAGDPNPPTVLEISRAIAAALSHEWAEILIDDPVGEVGSTFWSTPQPVVLDMTEAEFELGYRPLTTYEQAVPETVHWLVDATKERPWQEVMPRAAEYMQDSFDYPAEDDFIRGLVKDD